MRAVVVVAVLLVAALFGVVKCAMWVTRWRMERLLADFHSIYPMQSTWADAQRMMTKWGRWGEYEGTCTRERCDYAIEVSTIPWSGYHPRLGTIWILGGATASSVRLELQIRNGIVRRCSANTHLSLTDTLSRGVGDMMVRTEMVDRLAVGHYGLGSDKQLEDHPDYAIHLKSGTCCQILGITYTRTLAWGEAERISTVDLSCITRFFRCKTIQDLSPIAAALHLGEVEMKKPEQSGKTTGCRIDVRALGRDANTIVEVETESVTDQADTDLGDAGLAFKHQEATVKVLRVVKGHAQLPGNSTIVLRPFPGVPYELEPAERLSAGRRAYIVSFYALSPETQDSNWLPRCGVLEDNPQVLSRLQVGIAQELSEDVSDKDAPR